MVSIADGFGIDLSTAARNGFGKAGFSWSTTRAIRSARRTWRR